MAKVEAISRQVTERAALLVLAWLISGLAPTMAVAQTTSTAQLENRRAQMREFIQQQQVSLKNQLDCTSSARSLEALDRCQRGDRMHGGWGCPLW